MPWLLIRGLTREQRHWGSFPQELSTATGDRVLCLDAPGFGTEVARASPRSIPGITDDIRSRFLEMCADEDWSILGISLGGMVAIDWCSRYPGDFDRAVVINTSAGNLSLPHRRFSLGGLPSLLTARFRTPEQAERAILAVASNRKDIDFATMAREWAAWNREATPTSASMLGQVVAATSYRIARTIDVPLLVLASRGDRLVSYRCSAAVARRLHAPLRLHDTAGHDLPLDDPDWVCRQISEWRASEEGTPRLDAAP